ncbi:GNAT family N-acetyltransferase [Butyrivibrio proteoclasticus]|uniref:GNAT family N-acetyltransferase n=1 Tax=Butyrivibrio proteoclasticus TaxID=43305 RepID=UPI00047E4D19|nr:GNAT family N-acetyltransferase [Butyrivibrio proteoclasticus]
MLLRRATMDDALDVLSWRNDETTRMNSFKKDVISKESHLKWFKKKIDDENCLMYILEDKNVKAGSARVDIADDVGEISYMIAPGERGKGLGKSIIELLETMPEIVGNDNRKQIRCLVGFVNKDNIASAKCFKGNKYTELNAGDIKCYIKIMTDIDSME